MTQNVLEIDVMVYNMTKKPKIYKKVFLPTVLDQLISKITNLEKHRNIRNGEQLKFFVKYQRISLGFLSVNRNTYKV